VFRERVDVRPGSTIRVAPEIGSVHLFSAKGARLN
jgi:multiple sugar transport system ATP-binding protein